MQTPVQLGPFAVDRRIGAGGMGHVYRARHSETGQPVALKVAHEERGRSPEKLSDFRREARALAKLYHPAIAAIVDFGELSAAAARRGPSSWVDGAPWFAMEFVDGTPLGEDDRDWEWPRLRAFLGTVLDGLAHAHARSVIHRDLKPSNIMVRVGGREDRPHAKLVDFGIARLLGGDETPLVGATDEVAGTPRYMAPEQIRGEWRRQGPHTDLYSLGCLTWRLVSGRPPFDGETTEEILEKHLEPDLPQLTPRISTPDGFETWLRHLLRREPERRTGHPADAARRLAELDAAGQSTEATPDASARLATSDGPFRSTLGGLTETVRADEASAPSDGERDGPRLRRGRGRSPDRRRETGASHPPIPENWRRDRETDREAAVLPKTGLRLFPLREIPVVGRDDERERLWANLRDVESTGRPQLVCLDGGPGVGKSRLARWLVRRADELGIATPMAGYHSKASARHDGLRDLFRRHFKTAGLDRDELFEHLLDRLPDDPTHSGALAAEARALTELLRPSGNGASVDGPRFRFSEPAELYGLVRRILLRLAADRRLVVWLDDLHWGDASIDALDTLFDDLPDDRQLLVVATTRSDLLAESPGTARRLEQLFDTANADRLSLDPLGHDDQRALVDRLLDLDPDLADRLADRTEGHPLFTIQLLRDWVGRGFLEEGDAGFELRSNVEPELPDDIHEVWLERIRHLVESADAAAPETLWRTIEWAAVLGRDLSAETWKALADTVDLDHPDLLRAELVSRGLADETDRGWAFAHHLLVRALRERADDHGRLEDHHARSAELLERLEDRGPRTYPGRRADHREAAGELERALAALEEEYERLATRGALQELQTVVQRHARLLDTLEVPSDDPRRIAHAIERGVTDVRTGNLPPERAIETITEAAERARRIEHDDLVARAEARVALCLHRAGELDRAATAAERAVEAADRSDSTFDLVRARHVSGDVARDRGNLSAARRHYTAARDGADAIDDDYQTTKALHGMADVARNGDSLARASTLYEDVLERSRQYGYRRYEASALGGLGDIARLRESADRARSRYRQQLELGRALEDPQNATDALLGLTLTTLLAGAYSDTNRLLERVRDFDASEHRSSGLLHLIEAAVAADEGDWGRADAAFGEWMKGATEHPPVTVDHAWLWRRIGRAAHRDDHDGRAATSLRRAAEIRRSLGTPDIADVLDRRADHLADDSNSPG